MSQCNPLLHTNIHWLPLYTKLMWAKNSGKISLLTDYRIFWNPQIRYKRSPIYHWVSKLSQKWLLKVKNRMKSDNNRSHVNKSLHLGLCSREFSVHTSLTLNFKWLVQINSPFTHLPDSVKEYNRRWQGVTIDDNWDQLIYSKHSE